MDQEKKKSRKRKKKSFLLSAGIFLLILLLVLLLLAAIVAAGYFWMEKRGRNAMMEKQEALPTQMTAAVSGNDPKEPEEAEEVLEEGAVRYQGKIYLYKKDILTFLCMGIDKRGELQASSNLHKGGQADAIFLAVLDQKLEKISIIAVNRDTMTAVSVYDKSGNYTGEKRQQIALQHAYGDGLEESCERTAEAVSNLFYGLPIHGYFALNMDVIPILNDAVGGVTLTPKEDVVIKGKVLFKGGEQVTLDGKKAYSFVQTRDTNVAQSAENRLARQKQYIYAMIGQAKTALKQDMTLPVRLYSQITPYMVTDITSDEVVYLAGQILPYSFSDDDMYTLQGEVKMGEKFEEFYPDETALYELILSVFYEEKKEDS